MKKIITAMAAAVSALITFSAAHADQISGTSFESSEYEELGPRTIGSLITTTESENKYWFSTLTGDDLTADAGVITNASPYTGTSRPDAYSGDNTKYLSLDTSAPIYRTINANDGSADITSLTGTAIGDGLYLDTLVQFTAADTVFEADALADGDKIAISYVESDDGITNFVIRAGYVNGSSVIQTNYIMNSFEFDKTAWHRLTVRTIADVGTESKTAPVGFVVYVDGNALTYSTEVAAGDETFVGGLNSTASTYLYNSEIHALLPSAIAYGGTGYSTLSAVAFKGNGAVDDISFTQVKPSFITEGTSVTVAWDAGVASIKVNDGNSDIVDTAVSGEGSTNLVLSSATKLTVTATYAEGYQSGTWNASAGSLAGNEWTVAAGATLNVVSMRPLFQVGETNYGTFTEALAAAVAAGTSESPATIKMLADVTLSDVAQITEGYIVIDLNGKTLQAASGNEFTLGNVGGHLTITDSATGGAVAVPVEGSGAVLVYGDSAYTTINAGRFEGVIGVTGQSAVQSKDILVLNGGSFAGASGEFYLANNVAAGLTATYADGYYTVSASVTPTTYALTVPEVTGASAAVTAGGEAVADLTAIPSGTVVTVTWTADTGYTITAGGTQEITMDEAKTAATPTVALNTYILTIPSVTGASAAVTNSESQAITDLTAIPHGTVVTVTWTADTGYTITAGGTQEITMTADATADAPTVESTGGSYPSYIDSEEKQAKYNSWASYAEVTTVASGETYKDAYLLNCKPSEIDAAKAAFKITAFDPSNVSATTTTTSYNDRTYNGSVTVKQYSDVGCKTESATGTFFRAVLQ